MPRCIFQNIQNRIVGQLIKDVLYQSLAAAVARLPPSQWRSEVSKTLGLPIPANRAPAHELLRSTKDEKADLIVAGGYGHSRLGEWIFGGVTQELLASSPVCCMLSH